MTLEQLSQEMREGFKSINSKLDDIDKRIDGIDGRLDGVEGRLDRVEGRLDNIEGAIIALSRPVVEIQDHLRQHGFDPKHPADVYNTLGVIESYAKQPVTK